MVTFNEAMLSNDRTLAIRVGDFTSENIKSANFKYGYITGDDFTPGGTYAGTASMLFTSIVESFKKLDVVYPEIGLLVGSKVEWVKMGKYYIDDIKIDRNANTTEIELMDEMFKLNESFKTDLKYPAQIRDVILEITTKTGVTLASDDFGTTAIQQHVDEPTGDKLTYRDVLSQASQLLGFSCFFNRNGELEVRGLTESGITITADNYFLHGLEKSEVEYQIAGITCEVANDEKLTVGLQTGRSLEIENPLATQDTLNLLYYALKDIVYYPYDLSYQGHLKLDVGQWVTIKTNKDEVFKVPVLYQSFSFSGGLTSTISADSVAGSDAQYTYGGFVTKKIEQKSTQIQAEVQQQLKYADEEFKKVSSEMWQQSLEYQNSVRNELATSKAELETQIDTAKTQAESNAKAYADEINQATAKVSEQANAAANSLKSDLAKVKTDLTTVTNTANSAKVSASEAKQQLTTVANDLSKAKQDLRTQASQLKTEAVTEATHLLNSLKAETVTTSNQLKQRIDATSAQLDTQQQELAQATQNVKGLDTQIKSVSSQLGTQQTTLTQLVNDGNTRGRKIANFETSLDGVTTKLQNLWNGSRNLLSDTERLTGYEGVLPYPKNHYLNKAVFRWTQLTTATTYQEGLVMQVNDMLVNPKEMILSFYANASTQTTVRCYMHNPNGRKDVETSSGYTATDSADGLAEVVIQPGWNRYWVRYTYKVGYVAKPYVIIGRSADTVKVTTTLSIVAPALYHGHYNRDWQPSDIDMSSAFAVYKQTVDQNLAQLGADIRTTNGSITSMQTEFNQTKADIGLLAKQADFDTLTQKTQNLEATLKVQAGKIDLKAEKTFVDNLSQQVTNTQAELTVANDAIAQHVTKTDFNAVKRTAEANATAITQVNNAIELKAEKTYVEGVKSTADSALAKANSNANTITQTKAELRIANDAIETKATKVDLNNLTGRMSTAEATIRQTKDGMSLLATKTELNTAKSDLQSGITTATNKANTAQSTAANNAKTISTHTTQISALNTGLSAKVSQTDFNTLSGRVTTAENNITAKANELSSKISSLDADFEAKNTELKQTTDAISASVSALDSSTVKTASLTINTDGIVMKAGKSTTDVANAIGAYFAVNQNAISLFSDKINVKANMIVDGAITSTKIATKTINTAHLNGKIITADVISSNAITADAIKAGAVTTDKMTANSINGDRITAGTLDAAKIKAGSITASQIASGTITSSQIKAGGINTANIAAGAITTDKIISGAIDGDKIAANAITADKIATNALTAGLIQGGILKSRTNSIKWDLDHSDLTFSEKGKIVFTNTDNTISYTKKQTTGLLKFNDADYNAPEVTLGINRSGAFATNDGTFTGVRVRGYKYSNGTFIDEVYNIGDKIILTGGYNENNGFLFQTAGDNLGFFPRANRRYALGSPGRRFTTLYLDDVNIRISSTKTYSLREVIGTLAGLAGVRL
nr:MAG TPA: Neck appendage protein [Caudoviricetes sp.]